MSDTSELALCPEPDSAGILADDLTGALDAGVQAAKRGLETVVALRWPPLPQAQVVALSTDSRDGEPEQAVERVGQAARLLVGRRLYRKIDSTMRGHVGAELGAQVAVLGLHGVLVAPAFPGAGRTVRQGVLYVGDLRLEETAFALDPRWPMRRSHLPTLLAEQVGEAVGQLSAADVVAGPAALAQRVEALGQRYVVVDAQSDEHLVLIAAALEQLGPRWLPCGSAGLAEAWAARLAPNVAAVPLSGGGAGLPVLVVAGSRHEATCRQVNALQRSGMARRLDLSPDARMSTPLARIVLAAHCASALGGGRNLVLTTCSSALLGGSEAQVAELLGATVAAVLPHCPVGGLVLTGGDVARATCRALQATALRIGRELEPGIPCATLIGGLADGLRVVTKAGGFGGEQALIEALIYLGGAPTS